MDRASIARGLSARAVGTLLLVLSGITLRMGDARADGADRLEPAPDLPHEARHPSYLRGEGKTDVIVYPPSTGGSPRSLLLMLHGMCDPPENECPTFAGEATADRFLLCPRATMRCDGGGTIWNGQPELRDQAVEDAVRRVTAALPGEVATTGHTLVGFSLGAFAAVDVAQRQKGRWKTLVLLGAKIEPDAKLLAEAGIRSVVLGAGQRDMMNAHMRRVTERLQKKGIRARFFSMGDVGHWFAPDMDRWLRDALAWAEQPEEGALVGSSHDEGDGPTVAGASSPGTTTSAQTTGVRSVGGTSSSFTQVGIVEPGGGGRITIVARFDEWERTEKVSIHPDSASPVPGRKPGKKPKSASFGRGTTHREPRRTAVTAPRVTHHRQPARRSTRRS
jgi:predicted esterase